MPGATAGLERTAGIPHHPINPPPAPLSLQAYGALASLCFVVFFIYSPFLQSVFQTADLPSYWWATSFVTPLILVPFTEYSKKWTRESPEGWWATHVQW